MNYFKLSRATNPLGKLSGFLIILQLLLIFSSPVSAMSVNPRYDPPSKAELEEFKRKRNKPLKSMLKPSSKHAELFNDHQTTVDLDLSMLTKVFSSSLISPPSEPQQAQASN